MGRWKEGEKGVGKKRYYWWQCRDSSSLSIYLRVNIKNREDGEKIRHVDIYDGGQNNMHRTI